MDTERYLEVHASIRAKLRELQAYAQSPDNVDQAILALTALRTTLGGHLEHEDMHLYPLLATSVQPESVILGRRYREEMLDISVVWERYVRRWGTPTAIAAAQWEFEADTSSLGRLLDQRMLREERELYPAAQRL